MLCENMNITLRQYKHYAKDPSKDVPIGYGEDKRGNFLKFQVLDVNRGQGDKTHTGFAYVNVYTDLPLKIFDMVKIDKIEYVQVKRNIVTVGIRIKQTAPGVLETENIQNEFIENGFDF